MTGYSSLAYLLAREQGLVEANVPCQVEAADYQSYRGLRIGSVFIIFAGSLLGALSPIFIHRLNRRRHNNQDIHSGWVHWLLFCMKYFGSGVIIATAWMHLMVPAEDALRDPCLESRLGDYDWAMAISLMTVIFMFGMELAVSRLDIFGTNKNNADANVHGEHGHDDRTQVALDPDQGTPGTGLVGSSVESLKSSNTNHGNRHGLPTPPAGDVEASAATSKQEVISTPAGADAGALQAPPHINYPPGGEDHLGHQREHHEGGHTNLAAQMTSIAILEFGIIFHSIFIGFALALSAEFVILFIVLVFHQTFEGMGLGSRLAFLSWPKGKGWLPYVLAVVYALSTPLAIAAGLGLKEGLDVSRPESVLVNGIFDSISGGILMYTGLVELLAHDLMFNPAMRKAGAHVQFGALFWVCLGAALMSLLAKWA